MKVSLQQSLLKKKRCHYQKVDGKWQIQPLNKIPRQIYEQCPRQRFFQAGDDSVAGTSSKERKRDFWEWSGVANTDTDFKSKKESILNNYATQKEAARHLVKLLRTRFPFSEMKWKIAEKFYAHGQAGDIYRQHFENGRANSNPGAQLQGFAKSNSYNTDMIILSAIFPVENSFAGKDGNPNAPLNSMSRKSALELITIKITFIFGGKKKSIYFNEVGVSGESETPSNVSKNIFEFIANFINERKELYSEAQGTPLSFPINMTLDFPIFFVINDWNSENPKLTSGSLTYFGRFSLLMQQPELSTLERVQSIFFTLSTNSWVITSIYLVDIPVPGSVFLGYGVKHFINILKSDMRKYAKAIQETLSDDIKNKLKLPSPGDSFKIEKRACVTATSCGDIYEMVRYMDNPRFFLPRFGRPKISSSKRQVSRFSLIYAIVLFISCVLDRTEMRDASHMEGDIPIPENAYVIYQPYMSDYYIDLVSYAMAATKSPSILLVQLFYVANNYFYGGTVASLKEFQESFTKSIKNHVQVPK